jgi:peptidoglycan/xylan/chitin deacetylase (PgdA/CDA1 family)
VSGLILVYHRVAEPPSDPWGLCVTPANFAAHLAVLREMATPLPLADLVAAVTNGTAPPRAVAVTFDDGYADNLHAAAPLLAAGHVPATVFLASGAVASGCDFWWDTLDAAIFGQPALPERLTLRIAGAEQTWDLGSDRSWDDDTRRRHRRWRAWDPPWSARHELYSTIWNRLRPMQDEERDRVLQALLAWADAGDRAFAPSASAHRPLTADEVRVLVESPLVEAGAHTVTHPLLASLPPARQRAEVEESKRAIERIVGGAIAGFAYPYGSWNDATPAVVKEAGFAYACAANKGVVTAATDRFLLPRVQALDVDAGVLGAELDRWFGRETAIR